MPELPEVEIVRRELSELRGSTIVRVASGDARVFVAHADPVGRVIRDVGRRGKWLRWELDVGFVFAHLGMTGDWSLRAPSDPALPFERVRVDVERSGATRSARYTDSRRFGRFVVATDDIAPWRALGPDPWLDGIDEGRLLAAMKTRTRAIKAVLLDQSLLAGVGNIIAVETLWNAQLDPRTPANRLDARDIHAIARGLRAILGRMIAYDEATRDSNGAEAPFSVYGRAGEACRRCKATLRQIVLAGRGTAFCPRCQTRHTPKSMK
jgi:formamidopyrimidine-DNA glycosylase